MLDRFLNLYNAIKSAINISSIIKNKTQFLFEEKEIVFLYEYLNIFKIFIKAIIFLQGQEYTITQYVIPYIYQI